MSNVLNSATYIITHDDILAISNPHFCQIVDYGYKSTISNLPIYFRFHPPIQFDEYPGTQECAIFCYKFVTDKKI